MTVPTPLLDALYNTPTYDSANEAALDPETRDLRAVDFMRGGDRQIPLQRRDATAMGKLDGERFHRQTLAWGQRKGPGPNRRRERTRKPAKKAWKRSSKKKWVPRKTYLARKRKRKYGKKKK